MKVGVAYYPEQWPESRWVEDARLMQEAGVWAVRLAEFSWHRCEPEEGRFEFAWLERAIELLSARGIRVILGTPTPTYPAWLHRKYPDLHQVCSDGRPKEFGQRQDACKNHAGYRAHALRVTGEIARRFASDPRVIAWQTDNELGCHGTARCYCERCERAFQEWLRLRFEGDIDRLNEAWGTDFWSQRYNDFSEISPPRDTADRAGAEGQNPGLTLDFFRFSSDVQVEFHRALAAAVREHSPEATITHNLMGRFTDIDYFALARLLDVVSWDNYPFFEVQGRDVVPSPAPHDLMRGLHGHNVWVMEQAAGPGGWSRFTPSPEPGRMRLWALESVARGADYVSFFRWRTARYGTEQYWHGILPHHGEPDRRYDELRAISADFARLEPHLDGSSPVAEVGILFDYDSLWALEIQPHTASGLGYFTTAERFDRALARHGVDVDFISKDADFGRLKIMLAPLLHVCSEPLARKLESFVRDGGVLVLGPRSGVKDEANAIVDRELPGLLRTVAGCRIEEYDALRDPIELEAVGFASAGSDEGGRRPAPSGLAAGESAPLGTEIAEILAPDESAVELYRYAGRYYRGHAAAVLHRIGAGSCLYAGTILSGRGLEELLALAAREAGIELPPLLPDGIEVASRSAGARRVRFYLNHTHAELEVAVRAPGSDLLTGAPVTSSIRLAGFGVAAIEESPPSMPTRSPSLVRKRDANSLD